MLSLVRPPRRCFGYSTGCLCGRCVARQEGVQSGLLTYTEAGKLVYRPMPAAADPVEAYRRDVHKRQRAA
jgi:hypothetical protein